MVYKNKWFIEKVFCMERLGEFNHPGETAG
jgi:hypothetical protein